jgi:hypothetical protein
VKRKRVSVERIVARSIGSALTGGKSLPSHWVESSTYTKYCVLGRGGRGSYDLSRAPSGNPALNSTTWRHRR